MELSTRNSSPILLLRGGALGDFLLTLPIIRFLRESFPSRRMHLLASRSHGAFATWVGLVEECHDLESSQFAGLFAETASVSADTRQWLAQHSLAISWLSDPDGKFHRNLSQLIPEWKRACPRPIDGGPHALTQLAAGVLDASIDPSSIPPLVLPRSVVVTPGRLAIHPGSGSPRKNWPVEHWRQLLSLPAVRERFSHLLLIRGEAEGDRAELDGLTNHFHGTVEIADNLPLPDLAEKLAGSGQFLGHDSGVTHLAALLGIPTLALFGPTDPRVWGPVGNHSDMLQADPLHHLMPETVWERLVGGQ